jgi:hypothetical protein
MPLHGFCSYGEQKAHGAGPSGGGCITGHHIIPDHCFYFTSGKGKESCLVIEGYSISDAPVVLVTADANGGKSREHGNVHAVFDPIELKAQQDGNEWTYKDARAAAVKSLHDVLGLSAASVQKVLDDYFVVGLGMAEDKLIRAGEHGTMTTKPEPRRSKRQKTS